MRQHRSVLLLVTGSLILVGLADCASDSTTSSSAPPPTSQIAQAQGQPAQPPSGAVQEPGTVQPPAGTDLPPSPTAGEQGQAAQGEPPAGEVQERAVIPGRDPSQTLLQNLPPCGPTPNISKVCYSIQAVRHKSLTTLVVVNPGAVLTQPVTISIAFIGYCGKRITQDYVASTGNHFLNNDCEGDGKPRSARVDITLTEPNPAGGVYTFTVTPGNVALDPLYDVNIGPVTFTLSKDCGDPKNLYLGPTDITFVWFSPDGVTHDFEFRTHKNDPITLSPFAWARTEVSASANLVLPTMDFTVPLLCPPGGCFLHGIAVGKEPLVPGVSRPIVKSMTSNDYRKCPASAQFNITYQLRWYPFL